MLPPDARLIGQARKSVDHLARVYVGTHDGRPFIYISVFGQTRGRADEEAVNLNKGLTLRPACWAELLPILERAVQEADLLGGPGASEQDEMSWDRRRAPRMRIRGGREASG